MWQGLKLRQRLVFSVVGTILLVLLLSAGVSFRTVNSALEHEVRQKVSETVNAGIAGLSGFFQATAKIPVVMAATVIADDSGDIFALRDRMHEIVRLNPDIYGVKVAFEPFTFDPERALLGLSYYRSAGTGSLVYQELGSLMGTSGWKDEWYLNVKNDPGLHWTEPDYSIIAGNTWLVTASYPIVQDGDFIGVSAVDVYFDDLENIVSNLVIGEQGYVLVLTEKHKLVFVVEGSTATIPEKDALVPGMEIQSWLDKVEVLNTIFVEEWAAGYTLIPGGIGDSGPVWVVTRTIPETGWHVLSVVSQREMLVSVIRSEWLIIAILVMGAFVLLLVVSGFANRFTRPLEILREEVLAIAAGNFSRRVPVDDEEDEIGALAKAFNDMAIKTEQVLGSLETRVAERTRDLSAAAEIARFTTSFLDPDELLNETVNLIQQKFKLDYIGVFLVDTAGRHAMLRAATGESGAQLLADRHQVAISGQSTVARCIRTGHAQRATGATASLSDGGCFQMVLPLRARGHVIGALDVHGVPGKGFTEGNITVFQTLADQVAIAIGNARLYAEAQSALEELELVQRRYLGQQWGGFTSQRVVKGYVKTPAGLSSLSEGVLPGVQEALSQGETVTLTDEDGQSSVVVPLTVREQVIGALGVQQTENVEGLDAENMALVEALAEQFSLAVENLRLVDETQRRAMQEELARRITARMRESLDVDAVLRTAAQEFHNELGLERVRVRLLSGSEIGPRIEG
ncbi:MAG: GAF domain-containing protein [Anaerolineae bacterium]|nr:GAF domain-containing protein [Anaerolineae bacterium]